MFEVVLAHTIEERMAQEAFILSTSNHLEGAQGIESTDKFDSLITDRSILSNEEAIPQITVAERDEESKRNLNTPIYS